MYTYVYLYVNVYCITVTGGPTGKARIHNTVIHLPWQLPGESSFPWPDHYLPYCITVRVFEVNTWSLSTNI